MAQEIRGRRVQWALLGFVVAIVASFRSITTSTSVLNIYLDPLDVVEQDFQRAQTSASVITVDVERAQNISMIPRRNTTSKPVSKRNSNPPYETPGEPYYYKNLNVSIQKDYPWITEYVNWHNSMRQKYPGMELFHEDQAPKVLIVFQKAGAGGLTDRVPKLGKILHYCFEAKRILLLKWYDPMDLEHFLVPNLFNWTVPNHINASTPERLIASYPLYKVQREDSRAFKIAIHAGKLKTQIPMEDKFKENFGIYWYAYFRPSELVQSLIGKTSARLGLVPGHYSAIHCRVRHPAHEDNMDEITADMEGLVYEGKAKRTAVSTAFHAIQCSNWLTNRSSEPAYFYADAEDLVDTVIGHRPLEDEMEKALCKLANQSKVVGRHVLHPVAHIETLNQTVEAYASTFVDLYIAANARCITMGVGRFAKFASRLSGTECVIRHETPKDRVAGKWGMLELQVVPKCPLHARGSSY